MIVMGVIGIFVAFMVGYAFWPRRSGIVDGEVRQAKKRDQAAGENYDNPAGPNFGGPF